MKLTKLLVFCFSLFSLIGYSQEITVSGKVNDEAGMPIPGASVIIKGTTNGTTTDLDGNYQIKANTGTTLVFSFIGYGSVEEIVRTSSITVKMLPETQSLNEVVVVGYGTQKKSVVTGAISGLKAKDIENQPVVRVEQSLQGRVSGVTVVSSSGQPGSGASVRVRGITSINNNDPLWVVDGQIVDNGGIGYLNQSDIESIEVLKDAASQAIYGARSATGVILITTKKGKSGKIAVNYNGYAGTSSPARKLDLLNATQYATLRNEASVNSGGGIIYNDPSSLGKGTDWQDAIFNTSAFRQNHELSFSGGNDTSNFYISFGLNEQEGLVLSDISYYKRKNIRINSTHKVNKYITIGQNLGYSNEKSQGINTNSEFGGPLSSAVNLDPLTPLVVTDPAVAGAAPYSTEAGIIRDRNGNPYGISTLVQQEMANPLAFQETQRGNYNFADNFVGNAFLEIAPVTGLKLRSNVGGKLSYYGGYGYTPVFYLNPNYQNDIDKVSQNMNRGFGWSIENTINYKKTLKEHNFDILLGQGAYVDNITRGNDVTKIGINVSGYQDASIGSNTPTPGTGGGFENRKHIVVSYFARLNYDYNEKYLFTGIIRRDGSSRFGSNNKYGNFPSFSLGWNAVKEGFWPINKVVTNFKLRGGYGVAGSDQIGDLLYVPTITGGQNYTFGSTSVVAGGLSPNAPANPDLRWEETTQTNIGFDATFFNDLSVSFDVYNKQTNGILQSYAIPGYIGSPGDPSANVGDMSNTGIDLEVNYRKKIGEFNMSFTGTVSTVKNRVNYIAPFKPYLDGAASVQSSLYPGGVTRSEPGQSFNSFYGMKTDGIFQNQAEIDSYVNSAGQVIQPNAVPGDFRFVDKNDDGVIDGKDRQFLGNSIPKYTYGLTLHFDYKGFDFTAFAQGAGGNKIYQGLRRLEIGTANYQTNALNRWTGEGTSNSFPRLTTTAADTNNNFTTQSDFYLQDGDYLRLKTIQLGYSLPTEVVGKIGLQRTRIYVTGENVFTFTKYTGYDPEVGGGVFGLDKGYYPQAKSYMLGINVAF